MPAALRACNQSLESENLGVVFERGLAVTLAYFLAFQPEPFWDELFVFVRIELTFVIHLAVVERIFEDLSFKVACVHRALAGCVRGQSYLRASKFLGECLHGIATRGVHFKSLFYERRTFGV